HHGPHVGSAGASGAPGLPGFPCGIGLLTRDWIPTPALYSGARVESAYNTTRRIGAKGVIDRRTHDDKIACDGGRRGEMVLARSEWAYASSQLDLAVFSEVGASLTGYAIE